MKKLITLGVALLSMAGFSNQAMAAIWSANFGADKGLTGAGVIGGASEYWNYYATNDTLGNVQFLGTDMTKTPPTVYSNIDFAATGVSPVQHNFTGYLTGTFDATVTDLTSYPMYNVYIYSTNSSQNFGLNTSGAVTLVDSGTKSMLGGTYNWEKYTVTPTTNGRIDISGFGDINGLQIEAVPEPGTIVLLGVGGLLSMVASRKKESVVEA